MLAELETEPFDSPDHLFEIKWDGTRCIAYVETKGLQLRNRNHFELRDQFPELEELRSLPDATVVDSEIIVLDDGKPSLSKAMQRNHATDPKRIEILSQRLPATMMAFDLLYLRGKSMMEKPLTERRKMLEELIGGLGNPHVLVPDFVVERGRQYFESAVEFGLEGIMAKRLDSSYLSGKRTKDWLKIKVAQTGTFDILGYVQREGEPVISALLLAMWYRNRWLYKGKVGSGFTEEQRAELFLCLSKAPPLDDPPKDGPSGASWRDTGLRCTVRFFEKSVHGKLRAPIFECVEEKTGN